MSGSESQPAKPYQGPQFDLQNNVLSSYVLGNMLRQNPWAFNGARADQNLYGQAGQLALPGFSSQQAPQTNQFSARPVDPTMSPFAQQLAQQGPNQNISATMGSFPIQRINTGMTPMTTGGQPLSPQNSNLGFYQAGQTIPGQIRSDISANYSPYQFQTPTNTFAQRTPYQLTPVQSVNVADTYRPQYEMARRDILDQSKLSQEQQLSDLNRRGLLTTGGATKALDLQRQEQDRKLANLASQYSIEQGRAQLQEDQVRRQMEMQRQIEQAAELFRQQGASDAQAQFLANQNFNVQNAQAGQNLQGFQSNLAGQGQKFQQNLAGRQQATAEEQLANFFRRQPIEDLFKMWQQQAGPTGGTAGSPGVWGAVGPVLGAIAGNLIAPGVGGAAGAAFGGSLIGGAL